MKVANETRRREDSPGSAIRWDGHKRVMAEVFHNILESLCLVCREFLAPSLALMNAVQQDILQVA